jgi:hypothetical protein
LSAVTISAAYWTSNITTDLITLDTSKLNPITITTYDNNRYILEFKTDDGLGLTTSVVAASLNAM